MIRRGAGGGDRGFCGDHDERRLGGTVGPAGEGGGGGVGDAPVELRIARAEERGCALVQLMSDGNRPDAHRFYERLGFKKSHEGFKYYF